MDQADERGKAGRESKGRRRLKIRRLVAPQSPPLPWASCPVLVDTARLIGLGQETSRAVCKLRRVLRRCVACQAASECPNLQAYHDFWNDAIDQVWREWGVA